MNFLKSVENLVQQDLGERGLARLKINLISETAGYFDQAILSLAVAKGVVIFTGFFIPTAQPPGPETDGPPGALHLARTLNHLGIPVAIAAEAYCIPALATGLEFLGLTKAIPLIPLNTCANFAEDFYKAAQQAVGEISHWVSIERGGPNHSERTLQLQRGYLHLDLELFQQTSTKEKRGKILTMSGKDISGQTMPVHLLFDDVFCNEKGITRICIGDGGNEIGMGAIPWRVIQANIQYGGEIACATGTDFLLVAGVSNWGAWGLSALLLQKRVDDPNNFFNPQKELELLQLLVSRGGLVDGRTGRREATVDGLAWPVHENVLRGIASCWSLK